jgi:hypothetical protein
MYPTTPYLTPQERRRQKAMERQLPIMLPTSEEPAADTDRRRQDPVSPQR